MNGIGVMAFSTKSDINSIRALTYQVTQVYTEATANWINVVDCIVVLGGAKEILRELKKLDNKRRIDFLLLYSPRHIAKTKEEYLEFAETVRKDFKIEVRYLKE